MTSTPHPITADLARAARALAQVSRHDIAEHTGLEEELVRDLEHGRRTITPQLSDLLYRALEEFGVEFLPVDEAAGESCGVMVRRPCSRSPGSATGCARSSTPAP